MSKNRSWADPPYVKNHGNKRKSHQIWFFGSDPLIGAVTTIWAVGYNSDSTSFTTNLTSLRIGIIIIAVNSYDISELELQALREIVTISQSWNYKHWNKYLQCLIVGITIITRNSYNISDCNQTLAPPFPSTKIHVFLVNLQLNHDVDHASFAPAGSPMTWSGSGFVGASAGSWARKRRTSSPIPRACSGGGEGLDREWGSVRGRLPQSRPLP
jgi:hypothetical protein